ncbi:MAG: efflux RND transporter periplasmic adaptor subunit [Candidatus Pedobacter colombiensis]|uniref:Efflux RND transporter periplasmic adaptor subunit n=1 Tax=Candidatus Pedobacter colombiensis TaxID=3121371 RepID=A0AAJ5W6Y5_9SPHI|nr:efflux RND transporter periplasmic adaptor subunit [Pedobacter sp.]WEK18134.1 MAG: efflux RND transporter periplasmic adaptor subunit [Pedobacter sp.]
MRKNYIVKHVEGVKLRAYILTAVLMIGVLMMKACNGNKDNKHSAHEDPGAVNIDSNLSHLLKPSNEQVVSTLPVIKANYGTKIFTEEAQGIINYDTRNENSVASRVSGRIERLLIKYNYQPVKKGQLIMEVYSPDLAAAQQELLFLKRSENDPTLLDKAKQRLILLGMSVSGVNQVLKTGKVNYRIPVYSNVEGYILEKSAAATSTALPSVSASAAGGDGMGGMSVASSGSTAVSAAAAVPVNEPVMLREGQYVNAGQSLFTIYNADRLVAEFSFKPSLASQVKKGDKFVFYKTADKSTIQTAAIGMIQPVFKDGENFTIARVYLNKPNFRVGELLTARIPVLLSASWWLPESAVLSLGNKTVLFKKEGNVFVPKSVKAGSTIAGMVQIKEDISNWEVSQNAAYLVDSESFIKEQLK